MKSSVQKISPSQMEINVEVPTEEFQSYIDSATLELGKDIEVEGFRKGNAPKEKGPGKSRARKYFTESS